jgi:hypothetical protein
VKAPRVDLPEQFNVATHFVDRNLAEVARKTAQGEGKAYFHRRRRRVSRFGNARSSGGDGGPRGPLCLTA